MITRQQIIDIFNAIKTAVEGTLTTDSTVQNWPTKQQVNLSQAGTDNKVDVDFPASQTVDGTVGVNSLPALPAGTNAIGSVDVDNFPTSIEVDNLTGESLDVQVTGSNVAYDNVADVFKTDDVETQSKIEALTSAVLTQGNLITHTRIPGTGEITDRTTAYWPGELRVPDGAKGFVASLIISKASGVFTSDEGIYLRCDFKPYGFISGNVAMTLRTEYVGSSTQPHVIYVYPGIQIREGIDDVNWVAAQKKRNKMSPFITSGYIQLSAHIDGDFSDPEHTGFDFHLNIEWIYA